MRLIPTTAADRFQLTADGVSTAWSEATQGVMVASPSIRPGTSVPADELAAICDVRSREAGGSSMRSPAWPTEMAGCHRSVNLRPEAIVITSFFEMLLADRVGWAGRSFPTARGGVRAAGAELLHMPTPPSQFAALTCFSLSRWPSPRRVARSSGAANSSRRPGRDRARRWSSRRCVLRLHRRGSHRHDRLRVLRPRPHRGKRGPHSRKDFGVAGADFVRPPIRSANLNWLKVSPASPVHPLRASPHRTLRDARSFLASPSGDPSVPTPKPFQRNHHLEPEVKRTESGHHPDPEATQHRN